MLHSRDNLMAFGDAAVTNSKLKSFLLALALVSPAFAVIADNGNAPTLGGRLQLDYAWYDDDTVERDSGGEVRRARLYVKGKFDGGWDYKVQVEFSGDDPELKDGYLRYKGLGPGDLWLGHYKQPAGLEVLTSSKHVTFLERALITEAAEGRRLAVGYHLNGGQYTLMASAYGDEANGNAKGSGVMLRGTYVPVDTDSMTVHLGSSFGISQPDDDTYRLRIRPDSHVTDQRILDTGTLENVDQVTRWGLESALVAGRFSAQAEYLTTDLSRNGAADLNLDGWYVYGSWFLTPDNRHYVSGKGAFDKVVPSQPSGAWELGLRYANANLNDEEVLGGDGDALTLGLNWYANANLRFSANYSLVDSERAALSDDPEVFQVRMQIAF